MTHARLHQLQRTLLGGNWLIGVLLFFSVSAWYATAALSVRAAAAVSRPLESAIECAAAVFLCALVLILKRYVHPIASRLLRAVTSHGLLLALVTGVALRLLWVLAFPAAPSSDGLTYLALGQKLASGQPYEMSGTFAYWPPGYALFLSIFLRVLPAAVVVPLTQIGLFVAAAIGVYRLTDKLAGPPAASCAVLLFAIWPNLIAHSGTPEKEILVLALLVWAFHAIVSPRPAVCLMAGVLLGAATLVQPSTMLLIPALSVLLLMRSYWKAWIPVILLAVGAALIVAPWSMRNYEVLGSFKLVSTNGGDNLYRANNPLATGGYTKSGEVDLSALGELDKDRTAKTLAVAWMREHPGDFAQLGFEKQVRFMGDDAAGVFTTFRAEGAQRNGWLYAPLKLLANAWWLAAWLGIATLLISGARLGVATFLIWGWIYLFSLHSVFEAAGKYHVPILWIPCVLLGILVADLGDKGTAGSGPER